MVDYQINAMFQDALENKNIRRMGLRKEGLLISFIKPQPTICPQINATWMLMEFDGMGVEIKNVSI